MESLPDREFVLLARSRHIASYRGATRPAFPDDADPTCQDSAGRLFEEIWRYEETGMDERTGRDLLVRARRLGLELELVELVDGLDPAARNGDPSGILMGWDVCIKRQNSLLLCILARDVHVSGALSRDPLVTVLIQWTRDRVNEHGLFAQAADAELFVRFARRHAAVTGNGIESPELLERTSPVQVWLIAAQGSGDDARHDHPDAGLREPGERDSPSPPECGSAKL